MFFDQKNINVKLDEIYIDNFTSENKSVFLQVAQRTPHTLSLNVKGDYATMKVDNSEDSLAKFFFPNQCYGYFSLVSNNRPTQRGGYSYIRITSGNETLLEIDFTKLSSVQELERYFDCYYFETLLPGVSAQKINISDFWSLDELGHLICTQHTYNPYHHLDAANFCLLTFREKQIGDFKLELEFAQNWERYGVIFGCDKESFPYYYDAEIHTYIPTKGAFAYVEAEGYRTMRGNLVKSSFDKTSVDIVRHYSHCPSSFYTSVGNELCSPNKATIIYHIDADGSMICANKNLPLGPGHLIFLPPYSRYSPAFTYNKRIVIQFDFLEGECLEPDSIIPKHPDKIQILFEKMLLLQADITADNRYKMLSVFYQMLSEAQNSVSKHTNIPELIQPSINHMIKHFSDPKLTIAKVARASNISEVYFRQIFKQATGQLPNKYILNLRINHAIFLLQSSKYKVTEIATKSGFSDIKYFMTAFKKVTGSSPQKYRKLHN